MLKVLTNLQTNTLEAAVKDYLQLAAALRGTAIIYEPYSFIYDVKDSLESGLYSKVFVSKSKDFTKSNLIEVSNDNLTKLEEEGLLYDSIDYSWVSNAAILTEEDLINLCNIIKASNHGFDYIETELKYIFQAVYDRLTYYFIVKDNDYKVYDYEDLAVVLKSYCNLQ